MNDSNSLPVRCIALSILAGAWIVNAGGSQAATAAFQAPPDSEEEHGPDAPHSTQLYERLDQVDWKEWKDLEELLADIHKKTGVPAIAAAYIRDREIIAQATVGVQSSETAKPVSTGSAFHLGSLTKSFTATVVGRLVEQNVMSWEMTLGDVLGDMPMNGKPCA